MKRMFQLLIILFIIYFCIEFLYNFFGNGHSVKYILTVGDKKYNINEVLSLNGEEPDNYMIEVSFDDISVPFKIYNTYSKKQRIVNNIQTFSADGYTCVYLELKEDKNPSDIKCMRNGIAYYYNNILGYSADLDFKVKELDHNYIKYLGNYENAITKFSGLSVYPNNFPDKMYLVLDHYKGSYLLGPDVNNYIRTFQFFNQDVYNKSLSALVDKYYIVANYNASHEFHEFDAINVKTGDQFKFKVDYISFNSFIQGVYDNKLYIIDKDNKVQYCIDPVKRTSTVVNDLNNNVEVYVDGKKELKNIVDVINNRIVFTNSKVDYNEENYDKIMLNGSVDSGTYYLFSQNGNKYDVYAVYTGCNIKTYAFSTTSLDRVYISGEYIYYIDDDYLMVFSSSFGRKPILRYNELKYNSDLKYLVY